MDRCHAERAFARVACKIDVPDRNSHLLNASRTITRNNEVYAATGSKMLMPFLRFVLQVVRASST